MIKWRREHIPPILSILLFLLITVGGILVVRHVLATPISTTNAFRILAAVIALVGVLATASVTLVGYLLRQSIDLRTTRIAEETSKRADNDNRRLQMQTAMETIRLLSTSEGNPAPIIQVSAALITLSKLGENSLALDLAAEMWPQEQLTASAAVALCDTAIRSGDPLAQREAATLLFNNWRKLTTRSGQGSWPSSLLDGWPEPFDKEAQSLITQVLVAWKDENLSPVDGDFRASLIEASKQRGLLGTQPN